MWVDTEQQCMCVLPEDLRFYGLARSADRRADTVSVPGDIAVIEPKSRLDGGALARPW